MISNRKDCPLCGQSDVEYGPPSPECRKLIRRYDCPACTPYAICRSLEEHCLTPSLRIDIREEIIRNDSGKCLLFSSEPITGFEDEYWNCIIDTSTNLE